MSRLWGVFAREYASFFRVPLGWVLIALFLLLSGMVFTRSALTPGEPATMREFFSVWWGALLVVAPAVSMRLVSEELRAGTIEGLMTAPLSEATMVTGKFLAAGAFLVTALAPTLVYPLILEWLARPDPGPVIAGYLGVLLVGLLYLAVGTCLSALTASQTLAFLATLFVLLIAELASARLAVLAPEPWNHALMALAPGSRVADFARGLIDTSHLAYFAAAIVWFLTLATVALRARRWR